MNCDYRQAKWKLLNERSQNFSRDVSGQLGHWVCLGLSWNVLRRLLLFIRGLSELSGSLSDTAFPSQQLISAAMGKVLPGKLG